MKDVEEIKCWASGCGGIELGHSIIVIVGVCAGYQHLLPQNSHSAAPCDALIDKFFAAALATLADMCGTLGHQQR